MKKILKGLSVLQIVIGILGMAVAIATLALGKLMDSEAEMTMQQQALTAMMVSAVLGMVSSVFNFGCGYCGLKGAGGNLKKLSAAIRMGWLGLAAAIVSGVLTLFGDVTIERVYMVAASSVVPVLFLVSAISVKDSYGDY